MSDTMKREIVVLGGGPGGYAAAFRAADLGKQVLMIEQEKQIGGVCLHVGCIPSKTLLHAAQVIRDAREISSYGISFGEPKIDIKKLAGKKQDVVSKLASGVTGLAKARKVEVLHGRGVFEDANTLKVGEQLVEFDQCIIAVGSSPIVLPFLPKDDPRIWDSTDALEVKEIPSRLTVLGGGIIGLEMAEVYHRLGSKVTVVEMADQIIPGADSDLVRPLYKLISDEYEGVYLNTTVTGVKAGKKGLAVTLESKDAPGTLEADVLLSAVGRKSNGGSLNLDAAGVKVNESGIIEVDEFLRTNVEHIYAVGDVTGPPMLAHRALYQGRIAAEVIAGEPSAYTPMTVPSVAYTHPEVAWMGLTEKQAKKDSVPYTKGTVPWQASGRALSAGMSQGVTKVLFHKESGRIIGAGITGENAGELLAEAVLALEMGADAEDIALTMHAHPTLSETFLLAAEQVHGSVTDMMPGKK